MLLTTELDKFSGTDWQLFLRRSAQSRTLRSWMPL